MQKFHFHGSVHSNCKQSTTWKWQAFLVVWWWQHAFKESFGKTFGHKLSVYFKLERLARLSPVCVEIALQLKTNWGQRQCCWNCPWAFLNTMRACQGYPSPHLLPPISRKAQMSLWSSMTHLGAVLFDSKGACFFAAVPCDGGGCGWERRYSRCDFPGLRKPGRGPVLRHPSVAAAARLGKSTCHYSFLCE